MNFTDSEIRERRYRVNRTSDGNFLNMPRGLPLLPRRSVYVQEMPVGLQVFDRIHSAIASAERRLLTNPHEEPDISHLVSPISMLGIGQQPSVSNPQQPQNPGMYGLLPRTQAPIEFDCGVCFEKIKKGQAQQLLNCGHKFCGGCFDKWHAQSGNTTCPSCRTPVHTSMNHQPMGRGAPSHTSGRRNVRVATSSRFTGSQGMTPQQQAMNLFMRRS
jgi:hypothetical protein